jgi:hypothetical protein
VEKGREVEMSKLEKFSAVAAMMVVGGTVFLGASFWGWMKAQAKLAVKPVVPVAGPVASSPKQPELPKTSPVQTPKTQVVRSREIHILRYAGAHGVNADVYLGPVRMESWAWGVAECPSDTDALEAIADTAESIAGMAREELAKKKVGKRDGQH